MVIGAFKNKNSLTVDIIRNILTRNKRLSLLFMRTNLNESILFNKNNNKINVEILETINDIPTTSIKLNSREIIK